MITLRKASVMDFEDYKILFEDLQGRYQWCLNDTTRKKEDISEEEARKKVEDFWGDFSELENMYQNYTLDQFVEDLSKNYNHIYMIEEVEGDFCQTLGYICISDYGKGSYKIIGWGMFNSNDELLRKEVLDELVEIKTPKIREISINTPSVSSSNWLLSNGFLKKSPNSIEYVLAVS